MAHTPREVGVGSAGVRVVTARGSQTYTWAQIGWSAMGASFGGKKKCLRMFDASGKKLVEFADGVGDLEGLSKIIAAGVAVKGDGTADRIRNTKAKSQSVFLLAGGVVFTALGLANVGLTRESIQRQRRLADSAVQGIAQIEELRMAPNGTTPRLVYRITAPSGKTVTRNVQIERRLWDALANVKTIAVFYVPDDPDISMLAFGEVKDRNDGGVGYFLSAFVTIMGMVFFVGGLFVRRGWEIRFDSETKRLSLKRFGT
jgi:hypothetical protein